MPVKQPLFESPETPVSETRLTGRKPIVRRKRRLQGQKHGLERESVVLIRASLTAAHDLRGLALLNTSLDSCLRSVDLLALRVCDLTDHMGTVLDRFSILQSKTQRVVHCALSARTREAIRMLVAAEVKVPTDHLFTRARQPHGPPLGGCMFRLIVKAWCKIARLDARKFSGHSMRRTKPTILYRETQNLVVAQRMLGHSSPAQTVAYLSIGTAEALDAAMRIEV